MAWIFIESVRSFGFISAACLLFTNLFSTRSFLVVGDPLCATTHTDLWLRARLLYGRLLDDTGTRRCWNTFCCIVAVGEIPFVQVPLTTQAKEHCGAGSPQCFGACLIGDDILIHSHCYEVVVCDTHIDLCPNTWLTWLDGTQTRLLAGSNTSYHLQFFGMASR